MATSEITQTLIKFADAPPADLSSEERLAFMAACEKAKLAVENPLEATLRFMLGVSNASPCS